MSDLLLNERPLVIQPSLVRRLGIAEAALVQQLHYWSARATHTHDGHTWVYKTYADWSGEIGLSTKACRGALDKLRRAGFVIAVENPTDSRDHTLWWRIDYAVLEEGSPSAPQGSPPDRGGISHAGVLGSTETTNTESSTGTRASERVDPRDQAPPDFPDELRPSAGEVLRLLNDVAAQHGLPVVRKLAVGRAVMNHPRKPHVATARALHTWAADPPRPIRNVVGTFSTWLGKERDLAGPEQWRAGDGVLPANVTRMTPRQAEGDFNTRHYMRQAGLLPPGESV